jgi:hypothetical protein
VSKQALQLRNQGRLATPLHCLDPDNQWRLLASSLVVFNLTPAPEKDRQVVLENPHPAPQSTFLKGKQ